MRHEYSIDNEVPRTVNQLVKALVVPRPIAWVSTRSVDGVDNLAPHSFFTVVSMDPVMVGVVSTGRKDTVTNAEATGEFVVNLVSADLADQANRTATEFPPQVSEFDACGIRREAARTVAPLRVADSPAMLECGLERVVPVGDSFIMIGAVRHIAVAAEVMVELSHGRLHPDVGKLAPMCRLGRDEWAGVGEVSRRRIPPYEAAHDR